MAGRIPYLNRKGAIIAALTQCARQGRTIFYGELGQQVDVPARGPWKPVLDEIAREETASGRPDITFLVINKQTGFPGQIGFKPAKSPQPTSNGRSLTTQSQRCLSSTAKISRD
jgi:hypothetical protein